jgi:hypothetical protein
LQNAFSKAWPKQAQKQPLTVFDCVAVVRFFERFEAQLPLSYRVNVDGTKNVIQASREAGAACLIYTSSGSIGVAKQQLWVPFWRKTGKGFLQVLDDNDRNFPQKHDEFYSNYAYTKSLAENLIKKADDPHSGFRTGVIRPSNAVFGPGGDVCAEAYLLRRENATWVQNMYQNFIYCENTSYAHLLYEQRLIEMPQIPGRPNIGGQSFIVTDPNKATCYGDIHLGLKHLSKGRMTMDHVPPIVMLLLSYVVEAYHYTQNTWLRFLPPIRSELLCLQPALLYFTSCHLIFDDSRARSLPEQGGLGYKAPFTSIRGIAKLVMQHDFQRTFSVGDKYVASNDIISTAFKDTLVSPAPILEVS